jgi:UDP-N-acetylmuramate dehydrogenase
LHFHNLFNNIKYDEPMKNHTSFKVGGKADIYFEPENIVELIKFISYLKEKSIPYFLIGNGTNLLVSDEGIRGAVVKLGDKMSSIQIEGERIIAECGALLSVLSKKAADCSLSGLEFASGIPGSVGGAVTMNAGAYGCEIKDVLERVEVLDSNLQLKVFDNKQMEFGYRKSIIEKHGYIVIKSTFKLKKANTWDIKRHIDELTEKRQSKQPINLPSAGSVFKRPEGYFAGKLIEDAGLKGLTIGDAQISDKHCGFIINKGNASAKDIYNLIKHIQKTIYERFGVKLETEIKLLGKFE